ncbi:peptidase [Azospirillum sp. ST 5-10]|uniref:peptidase n=1 Tax=unclassified Azospirillum TaxID=2630922 RepID=UPI003F49EE00
MTYCLGIKIRDGLIALSDGRITSGTQLSSARKVTMMGGGPNRFFIMNSGLRSVRDKALAYLRRDMHGRRGEGYSTMLDAVGAFTHCLRQVAEEDKEALEASNLHFNLHALIGGQLAEDPEPTMFLVYPEGNWIEVDERTPYLSIGATAYGKPILDRSLRYDTEMQTALKIAYLSFDSTRFSSADVGFPIDMVSYSAADHQWRQANFDYDDLVEQRLWWNRNITELARRMPDGPWVEALVPDRLRVIALNEETP